MGLRLPMEGAAAEWRLKSQFVVQWIFWYNYAPYGNMQIMPAPVRS